jgi:hypothetical protein
MLQVKCSAAKYLRNGTANDPLGPLLPFLEIWIHEKNMEEANLLTLVTLLPTDKAFKSVTLQPLICCDALHLETDRPQSWPLDEFNDNAGCFGNLPAPA